MSNGLTISRVENSQQIPVLRLHGRLETIGSQELRDLVIGLKIEGHKQVVINLSELEFVASSGLGIFLLLTEEFNDIGGQVTFAASSVAVLQVISLLNIEQFLKLVPTEEDALAGVEV